MDIMKLESAVAVALEAHKGQKRKGDGITPYIVHPVAVAMLLARYVPKDTDILVAAVLHDVLEDTDYKPTILKKKFGAKVLMLVRQVSDRRPKDSWATRKEAYLAHLKSASRGACFIAVADKIHNVRSFLAAYAAHGELIWKRFDASKEAKIDFYERVYRQVKARFQHPLVEELGVALKDAREVLGLAGGRLCDGR